MKFLACFLPHPVANLLLGISLTLSAASCGHFQNRSTTSLMWVNTVTGQLIHHLSTYRVAQPAMISLRANMPANTTRVTFYEGDTIVAQDGQALFEVASADISKIKESIAPNATVATKTFRAVGFAGTGANTSQIAEFVLQAKFDFTGIARQPRQTDEQTQAWLKTHLDEVLTQQTFAAKNGRVLPYRIFVPPAYNPKVKYPLVVFLHGRGQRGTDNSSKIFNSVGLFSGPQSIVAPNSQQDFPAIVLVPQCSNVSPDEEWARWLGNSPEKPFAGLGLDGSYQQAPSPSLSAAATLELIDKVLGQYAIDKSRVYLTGISMGGFGTWEFTSRRPELFAAAVPMAGYADYRQADKIAHIPFWIFHGDQDQSNPVTGSRVMAYALKNKNKAEVIYTEYAGLKHNETFTEAWRNPAILPWLFAQRKVR